MQIIGNVNLITRLYSRTIFRSTNHLRSCNIIIKTIPFRSVSLSKSLFSNNNDTNQPAKKADQNNLMTVTFLKPDGQKVSVKAAENKSLYDIVIDNNLDLDGFGACEGTLCCTTCHLIFNEEDYKKVGEPSDEELDMLDLAYGLTETSRLGCQVTLKKEFGHLEVVVPASINDVRDG